MIKYIFEEGEKIRAETFSIEKAQIGQFVRSDDDQRPLRTPMQWYKRAIIINLNPLVLMSEDVTARWNHFPDELLLITDEECDPDVLKLCSLRYRNECVGETRYDTDEVTFDIYELEEQTEEVTAQYVYEKLKRRTNQTDAGFIPLPEYIITVDNKRVSKIVITLGAITFEFTDHPYPMRYQPEFIIKHPVKVYALAVELVK